MNEVSVKGKAITYENVIEIECGRTQANVDFSPNGKIQRTLKLNEGDMVEITIKKL